MNKPITNSAYVVANATASSQPWVIQNRAPTSNDVNYNISQFWLNQPLDTLYYLSAQSTSSGALQSTWIELGSGSGMGTVQFLEGNSGGQVGPDGSGTIFTQGSAPITVVGNPGANTLTIESDGTIATTYSEDAGSATPSAGTLNVHGGTGINTSGAGSTVTINVDGTVPLTFDADSGSAVPTGSVLTIAGGSGIATSGAGSTITVKSVPVVAFFASLITSLTNVTGNFVIYTIVFDTDINNLGSAYNTVNGIFTAPVTGYYQFNTSVNINGLSAANVFGRLNFALNGNSFICAASGNPYSEIGTGNSINWGGSFVLRLSASATMSVQIQVNGGGQTVGLLGTNVITNNACTNFSGFLIAAG